MTISNEWYDFLRALHTLSSSQQPPGYDSIGRALSSFFNNPTGIDKYSAWRVVGITDQALSAIRDNDFQVKRLESATRIERGHIVKRMRVCAHLFGQQHSVTKQCFEDTFEKHDITVLMCKSENPSKKATPAFYPLTDPRWPFDHDKEVLFKTKFAGFTYKKAEKDALKRLHTTLKRTKRSLLHQVHYDSGIRIYSNRDQQGESRMMRRQISYALHSCCDQGDLAPMKCRTTDFCKGKEFRLY